ncbi:MAG: DapH/DapD/GlmU-related protein [Candidatus ainarchaeum sp.]|nr:DapH/DapD/GlmU-related protein [Candidatus ainarchaeum sp.]
MRKFEEHETSGGNSLQQWHKVKSPLRTTFNFILVSLCKVMPSLSAKRFLLRLTGMRVGGGAAVGLDAQFDIFFPELIELGEDCIVGYGATVLAHEFLIDRYRTGRVRIGEKAVVGANAIVLCGVEIGDGAVVGAGAVVTESVPAGAFAAGVPARVQG